MRLNGVIFCVLAGIGSIFLACSRSDVISEVGSGVVSDTDPTLTDTSRFVRIDLYGSDVVTSYSLPAAANPAFSTTFTDSCIIGVDGEGDTLAAHIQYKISAFASDTLYDKEAYSHNSAYLYFRADESLSLPDSISVYPSTPFADNGFGPVDRNDKKLMETVEDTIECGEDAEPDCEPRVELHDVYNDAGRFALESGIDSVLLPQSIADSIFNVRTSATDSAVFAFSIVDYTGKVRKISSPYIILKVVKDSGDAPVRDSIPASFTRVTVFEDADSVLNRRELPYSSQYTKRTAVFEINLSEIKNKLSGLDGDYTNLNAVITLKPGLKPDKSGITESNYRIFVSDTKLSDAADLNKRFENDSKTSLLLRPARPYNTFSIKDSTLINPSLKSVLMGGKTSLYVYLRADSDGGVVFWDKQEEPVRLETLFTPSR
jgi:hypothetical protein